tara:strand:+ start:1547 stop:2704 length:1158 start_codon:yes stop_codon:yes gene_type:complete
MGTPIRLVRNDGDIIELMATTLTMNVDRGVSPHSMPFAGGNRWAFDLNLPKALITIEGVMTDDDILNMTSIGRDAVGVIDFSRRYDRVDTGIFAQDSVIDAIVADVTLNSPAADDFFIQFNPYAKVYLAKQNSTFQGKTGGGLHFIAVHDGTSPRTAVQMAASLHSLIGTYGADLQLSSTIINSPLNGESNTAVELTNINQAAAGNDTLSFPYPTYINRPYHIQFSGGRNTSQVTNKSAGDKVAELFAVLNNSNNGGGGQNAIGFGGLTSLLTKAIAMSGLDTNAVVDRSNRLTNKYGDYITAIQIPFTSNVNGNESIFYMPTGGHRSVTDKTANRAEPAGTAFDSEDRHYTGIKGAVANATFVQLGGEPLYSYTINFAPIDWIF